jgi:hypothetical protein
MTRSCRIAVPHLNRMAKSTKKANCVTDSIGMKIVQCGALCSSRTRAHHGPVWAGWTKKWICAVLGETTPGSPHLFAPSAITTQVPLDLWGQALRGFWHGMRNFPNDFLNRRGGPSGGLLRRRRCPWERSMGLRGRFGA